MKATTERRKHPVYRHAVYWATVEDDQGRHIYQIGPFRNKPEAMARARVMLREVEETKPSEEDKERQRLFEKYGDERLRG